MNLFAQILDLILFVLGLPLSLIQLILQTILGGGGI